MLQTVNEILVYGLVGIVMMMIGYQVVDWLIPCDFPKEIKDGNKAIGWVSAGIYIGLGFIIKSSVETLSQSVEFPKLVFGVIDTMFYSVVGIIFFMLGYYVVDFVNKKYCFADELSARNEAAGIMIFGIFVGIALIISGVIR